MSSEYITFCIWSEVLFVYLFVCFVFVLFCFVLFFLFFYLILKNIIEVCVFQVFKLTLTKKYSKIWYALPGLRFICPMLKRTLTHVSPFISSINIAKKGNWTLYTVISYDRCSCRHQKFKNLQEFLHICCPSNMHVPFLFSCPLLILACIQVHFQLGFL